ncbi:hypothetical protein FF38_09491 [Lucilia cuprina]|uniref:Uncharacterized protein n=1 Tax=Lucilia cuprina TaxID=7375 RepID=A0A0L0BTJ5_LUCCU|nr:hypothetical protein CVS40_4690 [Lucilia cuprina]KNC22549.1 hypothetical protein FF38_09491 [Lucilia cuprina]
MKFKLDLLLCFSIICLIQIIHVQSDCIVKYPNNTETSPIYKKIFGKHMLELPYNGKDILLNEGETIQALCRTNFSSVSYYIQRRDRYGYHTQYIEVLKNQTTINLQCQNNQLYFNNSLLQEEILECEKLNWSIYDANKTYEWCDRNQSTKTFLLAVKSNQDHHILAGICFNLNKWSLQTIVYNISNTEQRFNMEMRRDITKTDLKSYKSLGDDLWNLKTTKNFELQDNELQQQLTDMSKTNPWLNLANYEISPIVQGVSYEYYFNEYVNMLNTIWWRNLRLGNWKLFMNTLENYAYNNSFQLYTGTSGEVRFPRKNLLDYDLLKIKNGYLNTTVPSYIWTYLTSTDNQNEDFIIVAYNSPYAEFFTLNEVVFCPNICSEIPWLYEIQSSFHYATAGIMFCCSTEFMQKTNYLTGFPMDVLMTRADIPKALNKTEILNSTESLSNATETNGILDVSIEHQTESLLNLKVLEEES